MWFFRKILVSMGFKFKCAACGKKCMPAWLTPINAWPICAYCYSHPEEHC